MKTLSGGSHVDRSVFITRFERRISSVEDLFAQNVGHRSQDLVDRQSWATLCFEQGLCRTATTAYLGRSLRIDWPSLCSDGHCPVGTGTVPKLHVLFSDLLASACSSHSLISSH